MAARPAASGQSLYGYVVNDPINSVDPKGLYQSLPNAYYHGMARAMQRYIRYWMEAAGMAATAAAGGPAASAARAGASQMCRTGFSKLPGQLQSRFADYAPKALEFVEGATVPGPPAATVYGAGGYAAGRGISKLTDD